jgi:hypothetical protein
MSGHRSSWPHRVHLPTGGTKGDAVEIELRRIADALERLADAIAGPAAQAPDPYPQYPVVTLDKDYRPAEVPSTPHIVMSAHGNILSAVCIYCPAGPDIVADAADPDTCLAYEDGLVLDDYRAALTKHLAHH